MAFFIDESAIIERFFAHTIMSVCNGFILITNYKLLITYLQLLITKYELANYFFSLTH